jgi:hypothetical protein
LVKKSYVERLGQGAAAAVAKSLSLIITNTSMSTDTSIRRPRRCAVMGKKTVLPRASVARAVDVDVMTRRRENADLVAAVSLPRSTLWTTTMTMDMGILRLLSATERT